MRKRLLAIFLVALMLVSMLPVTAAAADEGVYKKVTSDQTDWTGEYLLVYEASETQAYVFDGSLSDLDDVNNYKELVIADGAITADRAYSVTVEAVTGGYVIKAANGQYIYAPSESNTIATSSNQSTAAKYPITFSVASDGVDIVLDSGPHMRFNASGDQMRFRYYKSTTYTNQKPVTLYKLEGGSAEPEPGTVPIATALAGENGTEFTVKGVVTLLDGKNVYIQDSTGGICLYFNSTPSGISLGDTVIGTGKKAEFKGLPELTNATLQKSSGMKLSAAAKTIGELTTADICTYVKISNVEVTEVYDNGGSYSAPNITVEDDSGKTIQIYKAVVGKDGDGWKVKVGDRLNVTAAVGVYNGTFQLRTTLESEIEVLGAAPEGPIKTGDKVVIYNPANSKALSVNAVGTYYRAGVDMTLNSAGGFDSVTSDVIWDSPLTATGHIFSQTAEISCL